MDRSIQDLWGTVESVTISCIISQINDWLDEGKFGLVDESLLFDPSTKSVEVSLAFIVATFPAKKKLNNRVKLLEAARSYYTKIRPDEVESLLIGLE
jgi:hypothetical protein